MRFDSRLFCGQWSFGFRGREQSPATEVTPIFYVYIVKSGMIDLQITERAVVIHKHELHVGDGFGGFSLVSIRQHSATAIAAVDSESSVLSRKTLIDFKYEDRERFTLLMINPARELARSALP